MSKFERRFRDRNLVVAPGEAAPTIAAQPDPSQNVADWTPPPPPVAAEPEPAQPTSDDRDARILGASEPVVSLVFKASSNIQRADLDAATCIVAVSFANGSTYRYRNFTSDLMAAWRDAKSAGSWFHANVRSKPDAHPIVADVPTANAPPPAAPTTEVSDGGDRVV